MWYDFGFRNFDFGFMRYECTKDSLSLTVRAFGSTHFVTTGFNPLRTDIERTECRRHDAYQS
ncbi:hypothetical protein SAMN05216524_1011019 [Mucilaginibacter sp. OK098]|nr:hypothetical protein SAMN05216524_1011019 [Mucilaginibacter sp. OK098]